MRFRPHRAWLALSMLYLAVAPIHALGQPAAITGTVYYDDNLDQLVSPGESLGGLALDLYRDDGDGTFDASLDFLVAATVTNSDGRYTFDGLASAPTYFVHHPAQRHGFVNLRSAARAVSDPTAPVMVVDDFSEQQTIVAHPMFRVGASAVTDAGILGGQRDMRVEYLTGPAEVWLRANPYGLNPVLQLDESAGVASVSTITWDGIDGDLSNTPALALGGIDLTENHAEAFAFRLGVDAAGIGDELTLKVFSGSDVSTAVVGLPITQKGTATDLRVVPFSAFEGSASFSSVDAIQLSLGGKNSSIDAQLGAIGLFGPRVTDIAVEPRCVTVVPEPTSGVLCWWLALLSLKRRCRKPSC